MVLAVLAAAISVMGSTFWVLSLLIPQTPVYVSVKFTVTTTPTKFTFSWDKQTISVCEYERRGFHRLWELLQIPRKRCSVEIQGSIQEFTDIPLGQTCFNLVHVGGGVRFERSKPEMMRHPHVGINWMIPTYPELSMNFNMPNFAGQSYVGNLDAETIHRVKSPEVLHTRQDVKIG